MPASLSSLQRGHQISALRARIAGATEAQAAALALGGGELGKVGAFKYLGRAASSIGSGWPALQKNLTKAREHFARISKAQPGKGAPSLL